MDRPFAIWLTGVPGVGKTTLAHLLAKRINARVIDGDMLRERTANTSFSKEGRDRNVAIAAREARECMEEGHSVVIALVSPFADARKRALSFLGARAVLVWLKAPLSVLQERDPKGLYAKQLSGELVGLTGVDATYEPPSDAELVLDTYDLSVTQCLERIEQYVERL